VASTFKNAGLDVGVLDNSTGDIYTASGSGVTAVIHAVYISNLSSTNVAKVNVKVTIDGGTTFRHVGRSLEVDVNNTLVLDKPINLENNDKIRIYADPNPDSSSVDVEAYVSILEIS
tara:strand:- start:303 stop:653 length:351 start_codon:yes stop_codon:yes gene_type:complete